MRRRMIPTMFAALLGAARIRPSLRVAGDPGGGTGTGGGGRAWALPGLQLRDPGGTGGGTGG